MIWTACSVFSLVNFLTASIQGRLWRPEYVSPPPTLLDQEAVEEGHQHSYWIIKLEQNRAIRDM